MQTFVFYKCLIVFFLISMSSCNSNKEIQDNILRINIPKTKEGTQLYASDFISDIEYVTLETHSQCLIGEACKTSVSENYILVYSPNEAECLLFSRQGKFIRKIGQSGNGPEKYIVDSYNIKIDERAEIVYLIGLSWIYSYRITGEFVKKLVLKNLFTTVGISGIFERMHWRDNLFCANVNLNSGKEPYRFIIFSTDGEIIKTFPNYIHFDVDGFGFDSSNAYAHIFCFNEQLYFKEMRCDTLFMINDQFDLVPEITFNLPGERIPTSMRGQFRSTEKPSEIFINNIFKFENYLFLDGSRGLYDLKKNQLTMIEHDPSITIERTYNSGFSTITRTTPFYGLTNDIDGGFALSPDRRCNIQNDKQFVRAFQSYELKQYLTDEYLSTRKIKDSEAHKRLKKLLADLNEDDNPVLMIATVK